MMLLVPAAAQACPRLFDFRVIWMLWMLVCGVEGVTLMTCVVEAVRPVLSTTVSRAR